MSSEHMGVGGESHPLTSSGGVPTPPPALELKLCQGQHVRHEKREATVVLHNVNLSQEFSACM